MQGFQWSWNSWNSLEFHIVPGIPGISWNFIKSPGKSLNFRNLPKSFLKSRKLSLQKCMHVSQMSECGNVDLLKFWSLDYGSWWVLFNCLKTPRFVLEKWDFGPWKSWKSPGISDLPGTGNPVYAVLRSANTNRPTDWQQSDDNKTTIPFGPKKGCRGLKMNHVSRTKVWICPNKGVSLTLKCSYLPDKGYLYWPSSLLSEW